jgi:serine/threonine protein kinase
MEFIKGKTLSEFCNGRPLEYKVAKCIFTKLLDIVGFAHSLGLYHRDLKPDNIIIREQDSLPIVIDSGICWFTNGEEKPDFQTKTKIELGNRFLRLPELSKGSNVTISTSDITFLIGVFYFLLTGKSPNILLNESGELPHYREDSNKLKELKEWKFLRYLFDKGFTYELSLRYQTANELRNALTEMEENSNNQPNTSKSALTETLKGQKIKKIDNAINIVKEAHKKFLDTYRGEILEELVYGGSGPNYSDKNRQVNTSMFLVRRGTSEPQVRFFLISEFDENFSIVNSQYGTVKHKFFKEHTINEKNRLMNDYANFGHQCAEMTMNELNEILIELYK